MRQVREAIHVESQNGQPHRLVWRGRLYQVVGVDDCWRYAGKWWLDGKAWRRTYFCITARQIGNSGTLVSFEMYRQNGHWVLQRVLD